MIGRRFALALGLTVPVLAWADALAWLQRMNEAVRTTTYEGTAVYRNGSQLETLRILHAYSDEQERERLVSLSGQPREVLRQADQVTCILPDQQAVLTDHLGMAGLLPKLPRTAFASLQQNYELIAVAGEGRVAGRSCREVQIRARDRYRYGYKVCLDASTALPLDIQLFSEHGELLEQVIFTQIHYPERLPTEAFVSAVDTSSYRKVSQQEPAVADVVADGLWEVPNPPAGFRLATRERAQWPGFDSEVTQLLYSDGLASVSVFATAQQIPQSALQGLTRMGGVNAYGRMLGDFHVTVVGEVPQATVRYFGDNLQRVTVKSLSD